MSCFWNCILLAKTSESFCFTKATSGKWLGGWHSLHVHQNRKTIPKPIKVFKSVVLLAAQLRWNCFTMFQAVQDTFKDGTCWSDTWHSWRSPRGGKVPFVTLAVPLLPPPAKKSQYCYIRYIQSNTYGQWRMYVTTDVCTLSNSWTIGSWVLIL